MRYRKQDANGDYVFGQGGFDFYVNSAQAVAQAIRTGLLLWQGEWFLDLNVGMPWTTEVLGFINSSIYDAVIQAQILQTTGVSQIISYSSVLDSLTRKLTVNVTVLSIYGPNPIELEIPNIYFGFGLGGFGLGPFGGIIFG